MTRYFVAGGAGFIGSHMVAALLTEPDAQVTVYDNFSSGRDWHLAEADPSRLKLEITESALIGDPERAEEVLHELRGLGLALALDDFGTGYSSLGYLHRFAIDTIKIDRSFVMALHDGSRSIAIVRAIVALARPFNLKVVAEGIESENDVRVLNELGCDYGQGYLFSKPLPVDKARVFTA
jgi:EAL domain-containing protein (putative c-di-GMP-specific phosphodiesterase class I)